MFIFECKCLFFILVYLLLAVCYLAQLMYCCIVIPACIILLFYCNNFIGLYCHMVILYSCNSRVYVTQVRRLVLRILYAHAVYAFILIRRLVKEEVILPLFLICVGYSAPSVWLFEQRVSAKWKSLVLCGCYADQSCIRQQMRLMT
jgi:hypothetical protein